MKINFLIAAVGACAIPAAAEAKCASVEINTPDGPKSFLGMSITGSQPALERVAQAVRELGLLVLPIKPEDAAFNLSIFFDDSIINGDQALTLFRRVSVGDLSSDGANKLQVTSMVFPISSRAKCKR